ncbi:MAG: hypothetical protein AVDCRST_MAG68-3399 [uncultured Gemmatimonadetes bacterium]|uniref:Protein NO VEIN C-terminal domain-containing protein n=1 Tax=uncultured Gemmatimonadota bacterium TaxID=203437 RepID=A0A6J4LMC0_9BACT|nr:MAG: hypothetical protein AVDCRST_MAG68-3399 [uncultured Gemmatimonadota bacterium]
MPLVLAQNERTVNPRFANFENVTGEQFHFIDNYRRRVVPGELIVYYRGVRRADGSRRTVPEYFGCGRIGEVWRDLRADDSAPRAEWRWYCSIEEYEPFVTPVPAIVEGRAVEGIAKSLLQVSVRRLSQELFERILLSGGLGIAAGDVAHVSPSELVPVDAAQVSTGENLWIPVRGSSRGGGANSPPPRRSAYAKRIGDRAEDVVMHFLRGTLAAEEAKTLRHPAREGETPGWDIEFTHRDGALVGIEVKGTAGPSFGSIEWTANERNAARRLGARYWLYLVAECTSGNPKVQAIQDPEGEVAEGRMSAEPAVWRLSPAEVERA